MADLRPMRGHRGRALTTIRAPSQAWPSRNIRPALRMFALSYWLVQSGDEPWRRLEGNAMRGQMKNVPTFESTY